MSVILTSEQRPLISFGFCVGDGRQEKSSIKQAAKFVVLRVIQEQNDVRPVRGMRRFASPYFTSMQMTIETEKRDAAGVTDARFAEPHHITDRHTMLLQIKTWNFPHGRSRCFEQNESRERPFVVVWQLLASPLCPAQYQLQLLGLAL